MKNIDEKVVNDFGSEWGKFDQEDASKEELQKRWKQYFSIFPWDKLPLDAKGFDLGCGSGRWAFFCAPRIGTLYCIDPAEPALEVAKNNLKNYDNCQFHLAGVDDMPLDDNSMDFGYSLGVLHHVPDTTTGIASCVKKLKNGAPFLLYLYYAFDNKPLWFKGIWHISDILRRGISKLPSQLKYFVSQIIALLVYFPLSRIAKTAEKMGLDVSNFPLSFYRDKSLYMLRTDALDRFGTRLEQRFTKEQMEEMMTSAGLDRIEFREDEPYWCAIGYKKHVIVSSI